MNAECILYDQMMKDIPSFYKGDGSKVSEFIISDHYYLLEIGGISLFGQLAIAGNCANAM